jgi:hypothetical protein
VKRKDFKDLFFLYVPFVKNEYSKIRKSSLLYIHKKIIENVRLLKKREKDFLKRTNVIPP